MFHDDESLSCLAVLTDQSHVLGVLRSVEILRHGSEHFFNGLCGRRSCTRIMGPQPLVFDVSTSMLEMSAVIANLDDRRLVDSFFVTDANCFIGSARMTDLIKARLVPTDLSCTLC